MGDKHRTDRLRRTEENSHLLTWCEGWLFWLWLVGWCAVCCGRLQGAVHYDWASMDFCLLLRQNRMYSTLPLTINSTLTNWAARMVSAIIRLSVRSPSMKKRPSE